jgi:hypothetical protein
MPKTACSIPSGNGGRNGVPNTAWCSGTGIASLRPAGASPRPGIRPLSRPNITTRTLGAQRTFRALRPLRQEPVTSGENSWPQLGEWDAIVAVSPFFAVWRQRAHRGEALSRCSTVK